MKGLGYIEGNAAVNDLYKLTPKGIAVKNHLKFVSENMKSKRLKFFFYSFQELKCLHDYCEKSSNDYWDISLSCNADDPDKKRCLNISINYSRRMMQVWYEMERRIRNIKIEEKM